MMLYRITGIGLVSIQYVFLHDFLNWKNGHILCYKPEKQMVSLQYAFSSDPKCKRMLSDVPDKGMVYIQYEF